MESLKQEILKICTEEQLIAGEGEEEGAAWMDKVLQLYQITNLHHGLMMVGPSGSGKTTAWRVLLKALERLEGIEGVSHVIDPKALSKEDLYGVLDPNTREWTDGLFTHILRKIIDNVRGELDKRQWIIFDGDVDPVWNGMVQRGRSVRGHDIPQLHGQAKADPVGGRRGRVLKGETGGRDISHAQGSTGRGRIAHALLRSRWPRGQMSGVCRHTGAYHGLYAAARTGLSLLHAESDGAQHPALQPSTRGLPHAE